MYAPRDLESDCMAPWSTPLLIKPVVDTRDEPEWPVSTPCWLGLVRRHIAVFCRVDTSPLTPPYPRYTPPIDPALTRHYCQTPTTHTHQSFTSRLKSSGKWMRIWLPRGSVWRVRLYIHGRSIAWGIVTGWPRWCRRDHGLKWIARPAIWASSCP